MELIVPSLTLLDSVVKESFLEVVNDLEDEILVDKFEEMLIKTFPDLKIKEFLKKDSLYSSWEFFVKLFLETFSPASEKKSKLKKKEKPIEVTIINVPEDLSQGVLKIVNDKGLNAKEKIFQLKTLGLTRAKVIELNFCHWTYVYELWRI